MDQAPRAVDERPSNTRARRLSIVVEATALPGWTSRAGQDRSLAAQADNPAGTRPRPSSDRASAPALARWPVPADAAPVATPCVGRRSATARDPTSCGMAVASGHRQGWARRNVRHHPVGLTETARGRCAGSRRRSGGRRQSRGFGRWERYRRGGRPGCRCGGCRIGLHPERPTARFGRQATGRRDGTTVAGAPPAMTSATNGRPGDPPRGIPDAAPEPPAPRPPRPPRTGCARMPAPSERAGRKWAWSRVGAPGLRKFVTDSPPAPMMPPRDTPVPRTHRLSWARPPNRAVPYVCLLAVQPIVEEGDAVPWGTPDAVEAEGRFPP